MKKSIILFTIFTLVSINMTYAEEWRTWTTEDGLPFEVCNSLEIDLNGKVWFSQPSAFGGNGITVFEGDTFINYRPWNTDFAISSTYIWDVHVDEYNVKWFTSGMEYELRGVYRYDDTTWTGWNDVDAPTRSGIYCVHRMHDDNVWVGGTGVEYYNGTSWESIDRSLWINLINQNHNGDIWYNDDGFLVFYNGTDVIECHPEDTTLICVSVIEVAHDSTIWIGTDEHGIYHYDYETWTHYDSMSINCFESNNIRDIAEDKNHVLWFASQEGLLRYDGIDWNKIDLPCGSVAVDSNNTKWIGEIFPHVLTAFNEDSIILPTDAINELPTVPKKITISAYPNPFNSTCQLSGNQNKIEILSNSGKHICYLENNLWQPSQSLESGIYFAREKGKKESIKLIYMK